jgi:16S rRNA (guanine1207-N2)-methyltransferase
MQFKITAETNKKMVKVDNITPNISVISRSSLNISEKNLFKFIMQLDEPKKVLILGNRTGVSAMFLSYLFPDAEVTVHTIDLYYANKIKRNLEWNNNSTVKVECTPYIENKDYYDTIILQVSTDSYSNELLADFMQQIHGALQKTGSLYISFEEKPAPLIALIKKVFPRLEIKLEKRRGIVFETKKTKELKKQKSYIAEYEMTLHKRETTQLQSIPSVFSHRRVDQGALALSEVVEAVEGDSVIDMGCGCGAIGISIALNNPIEKVTFIDANARAVYITEQNCKKNNIENYEVILSADGLERPGEFSLFVGNPPYFSNYKITELFIKTAFDLLKKGGRVYIVAKSSDWHVEYMTKLFGNADVISRRNYKIIHSIKQ